MRRNRRETFSMLASVALFTYGLLSGVEAANDGQAHEAVGDRLPTCLADKGAGAMRDLRSHDSRSNPIVRFEC